MMSTLDFSGPRLAVFQAGVQCGTGLDQAGTDALIGATLRALALTLSPGQAQQLAEWVPAGLGPKIFAHRGLAQPFDLESFLDHVAADVPAVPPNRLQVLVRVVLAEIRACAPGEDLDYLLVQLSPDLAELFD